MKIKTNGSKQLITMEMEAKEAIIVRDALEVIDLSDDVEETKSKDWERALSVAIENCGNSRNFRFED